MAAGSSTLDETASELAGAGPPTPGLLVVFSGQGPCWHFIPLVKGRARVGRELEDGQTLPDERLSRAHLDVSHNGHGWTFRDLDSRNGTHVNGAPVQGLCLPSPIVVRAGHTLLLPVADLRPYQGLVDPRRGDLIAGPALRRALERVASLARSGSALLITGETGSGKEVAAQTFHKSGPAAQGPLVVVNCAAIPEGVAESLLFGARKGAYSGAVADTDGYLATAHRGVLFLDELGELPLAVQAKLLRAIETHEVLAVGASVPRKVDFQLCAATHKDLRSAMATGHFRADLYFRIGRPEVRLPALRERREEIPWLMGDAAQAIRSGLSLHAHLVEACLLRSWPGNVRELLAEVKRLASSADQNENLLKVKDLSPEAGLAPKKDPSTPAPALTAQSLQQLLDAHGGEIAAVARALNMHRTQLYRVMKRLGL